MTLQLGNVTLDCENALTVAEFWSAALGRPVDADAGSGFASIGAAEEGVPGWYFIQVPEGKTVKNRVHVDLRADDREAEVARLEGLGAKRLADHEEQGIRWTTMGDVEGNEFCIA